ncbi:CoA-binding protein [Occallatibacter savannae]|uniref:CoA-binding protein n=1 Tax=Occallatibacter savannae TaxID=1002691 RepID=UPI00194E8375|nr:CoA-binding protein [Occallatibacter savannae]
MNDPALIDEMLRKSQTIAVVGMSDKPWRASHNIGRYLVMQGYRVLPVNPKLKEVHGLKAYPDLESAHAAAKADGSSIDLVDVFRASDEVPPIVEDVIRLGIPYLWLQEDVINDRAMSRARSAGVKAVQNVCIFREHAQRVG